jgi:hypothetical protein
MLVKSSASKKVVKASTASFGNTVTGSAPSRWLKLRLNQLGGI